MKGYCRNVFACFLIATAAVTLILTRSTAGKHSALTTGATTGVLSARDNNGGGANGPNGANGADGADGFDGASTGPQTELENGFGRYVNGESDQLSRYSKLDNGLFQFTSQGSFILFVGFLLQGVEPILLIVLVSVANAIFILGITDYIYSAMELKYRIPIIIWAYITALFIVAIVTWLAAALIIVRHDKDQLNATRNQSGGSGNCNACQN